jgi:mRNA interferase MazF
MRSLMRAGDVLRVDFGLPMGSEPGDIRPAIVVTADQVLIARPRTVHVVPITGNVGRALPAEVPLDHPLFDRPSAAQCHLCTVISVERIVSEGGNVGLVTLAQLRTVLADLLDIA